MNLDDLSDEQLELMEAVACGDRSLDDPVVIARRRTDPQFAAWLDEWSATVEDLDAAATMEREVVATALAPQPTEQRRSVARPLLLLAAIVLVTCTWWLWPPAQTAPPQPRRLGGDLAIAVAGDGAFAFAQQLPPQGYFSIEISTPDALEPFATVDSWTSSTWMPERGNWPDVVVLRVIAHDRSGDIIKEGWIRVP